MKDNKPKVSILVPIYNVERYLETCLQSIQKQTLTDIEVILINDGSTDGSARICDEFAKIDSRFKVIHKTNTGYGKSMNLGLQHCTGEYIGIVESDDFIDHDMYEILYTKAKEFDLPIVKSNFYLHKDGKDLFCQNFKKRDTNKVINPLSHLNIFEVHCCIWSAIYKKSWLDETNIHFVESPGASYQDVAFNFKAMALSGKMYIFDRAFVHYRQFNPTNSTNNTKKVWDFPREHEEIELFLNANKHLKEHLFEVATAHRFRDYVYTLNRISQYDKQQFIIYFKTVFSRLIRERGVGYTFFDYSMLRDLMRIVGHCTELNILVIKYFSSHPLKMFKHISKKLKGAKK